MSEATMLGRVTRAVDTATKIYVRGHAPAGMSDNEFLARAVLAELREPSEAMRSAGTRLGLKRDGATVAEIWRAMIDAALWEKRA